MDTHVSIKVLFTFDVNIKTAVTAPIMLYILHKLFTFHYFTLKDTCNLFLLYTGHQWSTALLVKAPSIIPQI